MSIRLPVFSRSAAVLLTSVLLTAGMTACAESPSPVDHTVRRAAFHAQIKAELGEGWSAPVAEVIAGSSATKGQEIYDKSCGNCHGPTLDGRGPRSGGITPRPPALVGANAADLPAAALLRIVRDGSPGTSMAPWNRAFTEEQQRDVVAYILAKKQAD